MRIETFEYHDKAHDWKLEKLTFSDLNLLVGVSGVGKTKILQALLNVKSIAEGKPRNGICWEIVFTTEEGYRYRWNGEFETLDLFIDYWEPEEEEKATTSEEPKILTESLFRNGQEIIKRTTNSIILNGSETPKLSPNNSVLSLLNRDDSIKPASDAFHQIIHGDRSLIEYPDGTLILRLEQLADRYNSFEKIRDSKLDIQLKLSLIYKFDKQIFGKIKTRFLDIFPHVEDLKIEPSEEENESYFLIIQIREYGVNKWIEQEKISSGMLRTIIRIAELYLCSEGTVILIDEFENSLGVNCIDVITEDILHQQRNLQFIITSHHPYIINNIDSKYWKIVQRRGGIVSVIDASTLRLSESNHEAFIQLINSNAYREGIETQ